MNLTFWVSIKHLQTIENLITKTTKALVPNKKYFYNFIYPMPINLTYYL